MGEGCAVLGGRHEGMGRGKGGRGGRVSVLSGSKEGACVQRLLRGLRSLRSTERGFCLDDLDVMEA